jgi:hypothetical protein
MFNFIQKWLDKHTANVLLKNKESEKSYYLLLDFKMVLYTIIVLSFSTLYLFLTNQLNLNSFFLGFKLNSITIYIFEVLLIFLAGIIILKTLKDGLYPNE